MFPVCIFGTFACCIGLAVLDPAAMGEPTNHLLLLLKFYQNGISTQFSNFTYSSNKLLGVLAMAQFLLV
jgi:cytochrome b6-f complex subunit 4